VAQVLPLRLRDEPRDKRNEFIQGFDTAGPDARHLGRQFILSDQLPDLVGELACQPIVRLTGH
jgi:hypothetical protein